MELCWCMLSGISKPQQTVPVEAGEFRQGNLVEKFIVTRELGLFQDSHLPSPCTRWAFMSSPKSLINGFCNGGFHHSTHDSQEELTDTGSGLSFKKSLLNGRSWSWQKFSRLQAGYR